MLNAVIDSAMAYEALKPIVRELRIITALQDEENANLREVIRLKDLQDGLVRKQIIEQQIEAEKKRKHAFRRGVWVGGAGALIVTLLIN